MVKVVGVRQLKARLREYLRLIKAGETILVKEGDEVVAELRPARSNAVPAGDIASVLDSLAEAGVLTKPSLAKAGWGWKPAGLGLEPGTAARLLDDLRG